MRKVAYLAWLVEFGSQPDAAYALRRCAAGSGWQATIYVDTTGWVVRLGRVERPGTAPLHAYAGEVSRLTRQHGGVLRGVYLEDLQPRDVWRELATKQRSTPTAKRWWAAVPRRQDSSTSSASA